MDFRTLLAAVLGVGLGVLFVAYPEAVVRAHTAGRGPTGRRGEYGGDEAPPDRWRRLVQLVGAAAIALGLYFGASALA
ncbi:hypothetical protein [Halorussus aquaticus]|uniref:DUF6199 domain-containing protein n=1 Tax=Halorussus aquaticus TaxID=2953748 RepID=A0ABD5Q914_9EURY|nr:hypothetical protein [Halorussus aquaticus]